MKPTLWPTLLLLPIRLLSAATATAQTAITPTASYAWVRSGSGTGEDSAYELAADTNGNVFAGGRFNGTASFGTNTFTSTRLEWQVVGVDADFDHSVAVNPVGQTLTGFTSGQTVNLRVKTANPAGTTYSVVKTVTFPEPLSIQSIAYT